MTITQTHRSNLHWNYFLALERDLEGVSRYIEFCPENLDVFSIELAHLLFAASSEVDVLAKSLCKLLDPEKNPQMITAYAQIIRHHLPTFSDEEIFLPRYAIQFKPWINWREPKSPNWWSSYNHVKHERNTYFQEATLQNALNAMGGLLVMLFYFQRQKLTLMDGGRNPDNKDVTKSFEPETSLIHLRNDYYYQRLIG